MLIPSYKYILTNTKKVILVFKYYRKTYQIKN